MPQSQRPPGSGRLSIPTMGHVSPSVLPIPALFPAHSASHTNYVGGAALAAAALSHFRLAVEKAKRRLVVKA
jgi:hypothetical protein